MLPRYNLSTRRYSKFRHQFQYNKLAVKQNDSNYQIASSVVLVSPIDFGFNPETAKDNAFMHDLTEDEDLENVQVRDQALVEFDRLCLNLSKEGIDVKVFLNLTAFKTFDAVFPNNWFSTHRTKEGTRLVLYPMKAPSRRLERSENSINKLKHMYDEVIDLTEYENMEEPEFLESTGCLILDRVNFVAYCAVSERASENLVRTWAEKTGYEVVIFHSSFDNSPIYHTNVMLSIGHDWAVICADAIPDEEERKNVLKRLEDTGREIVLITIEQMTNFCANILELQGNNRIIAMSRSAYNSFTPEQKETLSKYSKMVPTNIPTIETVGGGSVRCMIAELY
eukprot:TRINITY_DN1023_c0_g1_i1.p1 TRINITY_DN1023_c0_g1~~TRINITY_DN1023_c0_g1_i1.p1  ORF type:complete len:338 (-),score=72.00 TRINITY_DN1023_c0_g1_i1:670-1683(-)